MTESDIKDFLSLFPDHLMVLTEKEQQVSLLLYRLLAKGKPVSLHDIAMESGLEFTEIDKIFSKWGSEVHRDYNKDIVGFFGLSLNPTAHTIEINSRILYTWCAWDTLFIPELLNKTIKVESKCPVSSQDIELRISPEGIQHIQPKTTVVSLIRPESTKISENVIRSFCCHIHFFSSDEIGNKWAKENPGTYIVSVEHAYHLGKMKNQKRYPNVFTSTQ